MTSYLFIFGYETPEMMKINNNTGSDFEDSAAVFIEAPSEAIALEWGKKIANDFFENLYSCESIKVTINDYAHWIEPHPEEQFEKSQLESIPKTTAGDESTSPAIVTVWLREA